MSPSKRPHPRRWPLRYLDEPMTRVALRARFTAPWWRHRMARFGSGSILHHPRWVYGPHQIEIGESVIILHDVWLSVELPAWSSEDSVLRIGDRVGIRPGCTISAAESIVIEDHVTISALTTVIDSDHSHDGEAENVVWNPLVTSPVRIGRGTWIGERCSILRGANIGERCVIGAGSVVTGTIPDGSVAVGAPARVIGSTSDAAPSGERTLDGLSSPGSNG